MVFFVPSGTVQHILFPDAATAAVHEPDDGAHLVLAFERPCVVFSGRGATVGGGFFWQR